MTGESSARTCRRVTYRGRVQGVGFRYTTHSIAGRFSVEGYVRNLADGSVELVACGAPGEVEAFLTEIAATFRKNIASTSSAEHVPDETPHGFSIRG